MGVVLGLISYGLLATLINILGAPITAHPVTSYLPAALALPIGIWQVYVYAVIFPRHEAPDFPTPSPLVEISRSESPAPCPPFSTGNSPARDYRPGRMVRAQACPLAGHGPHALQFTRQPPNI